MSDRLKQMEEKIKTLEKQVVENKKLASEDKTKYPIIIGHRKYVSATHWYYC